MLKGNRPIGSLFLSSRGRFRNFRDLILPGVPRPSSPVSLHTPSRSRYSIRKGKNDLSDLTTNLILSRSDVFFVSSSICPIRESLLPRYLSLFFHRCLHRFRNRSRHDAKAAKNTAADFFSPLSFRVLVTLPPLENRPPSYPAMPDFAEASFSTISKSSGKEKTVQAERIAEREREREKTWYLRNDNRSRINIV